MDVTTYTIRHSHGLTESHDSYATAVEALKSVYGAEVYAVDGNGWECTDSEEWPDGSGHGSILVWSDESSSEGDDGTRAVAWISRAVALPAFRHA